MSPPSASGRWAATLPLHSLDSDHDTRCSARDRAAGKRTELKHPSLYQNMRPHMRQISRAMGILVLLGLAAGCGDSNGDVNAPPVGPVATVVSATGDITAKVG